MTARRWLPFLAAVAAALVWLAAGELPTPARVFTVLLVGVLPPLLLLQAQVQPEELRERSILPVYVSSMLLIGALGVAALWTARASGFDVDRIGLVALPAATMLAWTGGITLAAIILVAGFRALGWHESHVVAWLLPKSTSERIVFVALSICAGLGEEMAFRAFLIPALDVATGSTALAVVVSSAAFGMMHGYQRASGAVRAGALGALLAVPFLVTGSIHPSMAAHAAYDVIAGLLLGDWLVRAPGPNERNSGP